MMHIFDKSFWTKKKFEYVGAMVIGIFASLYVFCSSIDSGMTQKIVQDYIERANAYSFFQAKRIREEINELFYYSTQQNKLIQTPLSPEVKKILEEHEQKLKYKIERFQDKNNPEGREMLLKRAKSFDHEINQLNAQDAYLGIANNLYQLSIIMASIALVIASPLILIISILLGSVGFALHMYGLYGVL